MHRNMLALLVITDASIPINGLPGHYKLMVGQESWLTSMGWGEGGGGGERGAGQKGGGGLDRTDHQGSSAAVHLKAGSWEHRAVTVAPP